MDKRIKDRLIQNSLALYKQGGYPSVVGRAKEIYGGNKQGLVNYLSDFNKYMEVLASGRKGN
jgi:hypothetical protein